MMLRNDARVLNFKSLCIELWIFILEWSKSFFEFLFSFAKIFDTYCVVYTTMISCKGIGFGELILM